MHVMRVFGYLGDDIPLAVHQPLAHHHPVTEVAGDAQLRQRRSTSRVTQGLKNERPRWVSKLQTTPCRSAMAWAREEVDLDRQRPGVAARHDIEEQRLAQRRAREDLALEVLEVLIGRGAAIGNIAAGGADLGDPEQLVGLQRLRQQLAFTIIFRGGRLESLEARVASEQGSLFSRTRVSP
jgi:hypothetical protein